ncbi:MAG: PAS domain S-box protein, partial [Sphingomonas sp.]|nr:PAS domain S-box protein [Sphingomonas sp.]
MTREKAYPLHAPDDSELRELIAAYDWAATPLGPIEAWPGPLVDTLSMMLSAPLPMVLFWGPALIALYNDAYARGIGDRHPDVLGGRGEEKWAHIWDDVGPVIARVRETRKGEMVNDRVFPLWRKGVTSMAQLDIAYNPVRAPDGGPGGVLCIIYEMTERAQAIDDANRERARLARMFEQAPSFMALLREPGHVFDFANAAYLQLIGRRPVLGLPMREALPEIAAQGFVALLDDVVKSGKPYSGRAVPVALQRQPGEGEEQ